MNGLTGGYSLVRLNKRVLDTGSPVLLRMFLTSIFISADISTKEKQLYCDRLCDQGSLYKGQVSIYLGTFEIYCSFAEESSVSDHRDDNCVI